jgi:hypothetical protein
MVRGKVTGEGEGEGEGGLALLDLGRPLVVKEEHATTVTADATVVGGGEDSE